MPRFIVAFMITKNPFKFHRPLSIYYLFCYMYSHRMELLERGGRLVESDLWADKPVYNSAMAVFVDL